MCGGLTKSERTMKPVTKHATAGTVCALMLGLYGCRPTPGSATPSIANPFDSGKR
jgi:hypothetical protein